MLEILAYTSGILGVIASLIEILQFFKILQNKHKILILIVVSIATSICFGSWYLIDKKNEQEKIEKIKNSYLIQDAKTTSEGITVNGYSNAGDYLSSLIQITGFYNRHKDRFTYEYEMYKKEVDNWSKIIQEKKQLDKNLYYSDYRELEGLVTSGKSNIYQLIPVNE